jgi:hypothetical protein
MYVCMCACMCVYVCMYMYVCIVHALLRVHGTIARSCCSKRWGVCVCVCVCGSQVSFSAHSSLPQLSLVGFLYTVLCSLSRLFFFTRRACSRSMSGASLCVRHSRRAVCTDGGAGRYYSVQMRMIHARRKTGTSWDLESNWMSCHISGVAANPPHPHKSTHTLVHILPPVPSSLPSFTHARRSSVPYYSPILHAPSSELRFLLANALDSSLKY